jgi:hypothetical protein
MLIRCFPGKREIEENALVDCGIIKYRRKIYIFVEPNAYRHNAVKNAKAVIINESVSKGSKEGNIMHIAVDNSVIIRHSVYFCDVQFEIPGNVNYADFRITSAFSKESQSLFDQGKVANYFIGSYSAALNKLEYNNRMAFDELVGDMDTTVLPPIYYNEVHQYKQDCDIFCLGGATVDIFSGKELIDNKTVIEFMDVNLWDTMRYKMFGVMDSVEDKVSNTLEAARLFHSDFSNFIGEDCTFIYDSDGKGMNEPGINIVGGGIPFKPYYVKSHIPLSVNTAYSLFESTCHDIEREYGHIKIHCAPGKIGDKIKIKFKDFNNTPTRFIPLGGKTIEGDASSVDSGYHIEKNIDDMIEVIETAYNQMTPEEIYSYI